MQIHGEQHGNKMNIEITFDNPDQIPKFHESFLNALKAMAEQEDASLYNIAGDPVNSLEDGYTSKEVHSSAKLFSNWL